MYILGHGKAKRHLIGVAALDFGKQLPPDLGAAQVGGHFQAGIIGGQGQRAVFGAGKYAALMVVLHNNIGHIAVIKGVRVDLFHDAVSGTAVAHVLIQQVGLVERAGVALHFLADIRRGGVGGSDLQPHGAVFPAVVQLFQKFVMIFHW